MPFRLRLALVMLTAASVHCRPESKARPPRARRSCAPFDEPAALALVFPARMDPPEQREAALAEHFARYESCTCRADPGTESEAAGAHQERACGPFPCTDGGCYVQRCGTDDDCTIGLCSSHASWPNGYCVNSDPK